MSEVMSGEYTADGKYLRKVKSFVLREGRLTKGQEAAMEQYWSVYGLDFTQEKIDLAQVFQNQAPVVLEIGFGMGHSLVEMAKAAPEKNFIGIEVHKPGVGACIQAAAQAELKNLKVIHYDAVEVLECMIEDASLDCIQLFFADPWHKKKHHKRRIVQIDFVTRVAHKLKQGGLFHMATDWENYAEHMLEVMSQVDLFVNQSPTDDFIPRPAHRPLTKFEQRGQRLGHGVWDLLYSRKD